MGPEEEEEEEEWALLRALSCSVDRLLVAGLVALLVSVDRRRESLRNVEGARSAMLKEIRDEFAEGRVISGQVSFGGVGSLSTVGGLSCEVGVLGEALGRSGCGFPTGDWEEMKGLEGGDATATAVATVGGVVWEEGGAGAACMMGRLGGPACRLEGRVEVGGAVARLLPADSCTLPG